MTFVPRFRRSISEATKLPGATSLLIIWEFRSASRASPIGPQALQMPVRKTSARSARGVAGAGIP